MSAFSPGTVAKFRTRLAARDAIARDNLNMWPYTGNSRRWRPLKSGQVWVINSPGRRATWGDLPATHAVITGQP